MAGERRVFDKEFKLMSVELSGPPRGNSRTDLGVPAKELNIPSAMLYRGAENLLPNKTAVFQAMEKLY